MSLAQSQARRRMRIAQVGRKAETAWRSIEDRFWTKVNKTDLCWEWLGRDDGKGYGRIHLRGCSHRAVPAHRLSWELANGPIPAGMCIIHKCDNPRCVRPDHLLIGTLAQNNNDRTAKGRQAKGEGAAGAKLNELQVRILRRLYRKVGCKFAAQVFGIGAANAWKVMSGRAWKHVNHAKY